MAQCGSIQVATKALVATKKCNKFTLFQVATRTRWLFHSVAICKLLKSLEVVRCLLRALYKVLYGSHLIRRGYHYGR